jgi:uncharacterized membrane protein
MERHIERQNPSQASPRLVSIDALRGLAVLFMITQHMAFWLDAEPRSRWLIQFTGALGGMAAPLFITLSGVGVSLMTTRRMQIDRLLFIRGAIIVACGYLLNMLTPHWFSLGSWYVLHLIGTALLTAPLLRRVSDTSLIVMILAVLAATGILQHDLGTPLRLYNTQMAAPVDFFGGFRFALVEGFFPIFPWISLFMAGLLAGRWVRDGRPEYIERLGSYLFAAMAILSTVYLTGFDFTRTGPWIRYFKIQPTFYAALTPVILLLMALSLLFVSGFLTFEEKCALTPPSTLVCLGRASLTFLIVHVAGLREMIVVTAHWKSLTTIGTVLLTLSVLAAFSLAARLWQKINFNYGFEWLLRRLSAPGG